jgi:nucleoid-associated protein YgaU
MLEQYKRDVLPTNDDKDLAIDNESMGKRKLLFVVTGASLALLFFLFLIGLFRADEDALAVKDVKSEMATKENFLALEERIATLTARLDKIEKTAGPVEQAPLAQTVQAASMPALQSTEEAAAMTNDALRHFIAHATEQEPAQEPIVVESKAKKQPAAKVAAKPKAKKAPVTVASNRHVVQKGDTLSKISQRYYGTTNRWKSIYDANKDRIANINNLKVGTELVIPQAKQ